MAEEKVIDIVAEDWKAAAVVPDLREARRRSVRTFQEDRGTPVILQLAVTADEAPGWWSPTRDAYLRKFWPTEPYMSGAVYTIAARNASFRYEFTGPPRQVKWCQQLFAQADLGAGWQQMMMKVTTDYLSQDNFAFIEIIRPTRARVKDFQGRLARWNGIALPAHKMYVDDRVSEYSGVYEVLEQLTGVEIEDRASVWGVELPGNKGLVPLIGYDYKLSDVALDLPLGLAHLDAGLCRRTGNPEWPVVYTDISGKDHKLRWYQVMTLEDMPSPIQAMNGVGHCFVTRALRLAQTLRDIEKIKWEKAAGRFAGRVYLTNVDAEAISDAVEEASENADARGLHRYMPPVIAQTLEPGDAPAVATIDMASLPEGFSEDQTLQWYIAGLAVDAGVDYGFLAPLPGKGLGTAAQSETQERQAKGKSSRLFMAQTEHKFNFSGIIPRSCAFTYREVDIQEEGLRDQGRKTRADTRSVLIQSGEISPEMARQMAVDDGDYPASYLAMAGEGDQTPQITLGDSDNAEAQQQQLHRVAGTVGEGAQKPEDRLAEQAQQAKPQEQGEKGGSGSGWFGPPKGTHTAERGGSLPKDSAGTVPATSEGTPKAVADWEEKQFAAGPARIERMIIVTGGSPIQNRGVVQVKKEGDSEQIVVPSGDYRNSILTHTHPSQSVEMKGPDRVPVIVFDKNGVCQPPSPSDLVVASYHNLSEIRVVGHSQGLPVRYVVRRPPGGWGKHGKFVSRVHAVKNEIVEQHGTDLLDQGHSLGVLSMMLLNRSWRELAEETGMEYEVEYG